MRAAGLHPDYWYPVEYDDRVRGGQVVEVRFWGQSIALYRGADGRMRALENRCAHRQLPLSPGAVTGCELTCAYHGWRYGEDGRLTAIPHELFGHAQPTVGVATYPVRVRHGLVWLIPGDPALAARRAIPEIPALDGPDPWAYVPLDLTWRAHHSMVMANLCDLSHAHPHRRFPSFLPARLLSCAADADRVAMRYEARVGSFAHRAWAEPRLLEIVSSTRTTGRAFSGPTSTETSPTGHSSCPPARTPPACSSCSATTHSRRGWSRSGSGTACSGRSCGSSGRACGVCSARTGSRSKPSKPGGIATSSSRSPT